MNKFVNAVTSAAQFNGVKTYTENGAVARNSTYSRLLDAYGLLGAMRNRDEGDIIDLFKKAWNEDALLALKLAFYNRNIRGGQGERDSARTCLKWVANTYPRTMIKNFGNVTKFGRADDLYIFIGTPVEADMWAFVKAQLTTDMKGMTQGKPISIMAKWLKSVNTSSAESRELGRRTARNLGLSEREYRQMLSAMRGYLEVVEVQMSKGKWTDIDYEKVPSRAMKKYKAAFMRHGKSFEKFLTQVEKGEKEIKAGTLYPYDLVREYINTGYYGYRRSSSYLSATNKRTIEAQWKALPNYIEEGANVLVMADVSGSMFCDDNRPISSSIGLALYFAERNTGAFKNLYMTFTNEPHYISINPGNSLEDNVKAVQETDMGYNTNLEKAMMRVLKTCVENGVPQSDVPKALVVVSDMQIDSFFRGQGLDFVSEMAARWANYGYVMPQLVMWNVEARSNVFHGSYKNPYVQFCSGSSASTFKSVLDAIGCTAIEAMLKTLNDPMYDSVVL